MFASTFHRTFRRSALALALAAAAGMTSAETLHIELDTSSFANLGSGGWLDLSFAAGSGGNAVLATAALSHLTGFDASQAAQTQISGNVSGSLATGFTMDNSAPADLFQAVHFGGKVDFDVTISGAIDPALASKSTFAATLYGNDQMTQLGNSTSASGSLVELTWTPAAAMGQTGSVASTIYANGLATVSAVPEPSSWLMLGAGLALVGFVARRKQAA